MMPAPLTTSGASSPQYGVPGEDSEPSAAVLADSSTSPSATTRARPSRGISAVAAGAAKAAASGPGSSASPAVRGDQPRTTWKYREKASDSVDEAKIMTRLEPTAPLKAGVRNSRRSIRGSSTRTWRRANSVRAAAPTAAAIHTGAWSVPSRKPSLIA